MLRVTTQTKLLAVAIALLFIGTAIDAKPPSRSSSRSSSRPKYGSSRPSTSRPSRPKYGSRPSSRPSTGSKRPSASKRPSSSSSSKAKENRKHASKRKYEATKKATNPPKSSYKTASGKTVKVRTQSKTVQSMRSKPSSYYTPAARQQRINVHVTNHYSHPYSYYHVQPHYYVGGGYSSSFWYMMSEWSYQRRAMWLYHNQHSIEQSAYQRGMQDAQVSAELARLRSAKTPLNNDYVDSEFKDNPAMQYSQEYVEAAYNPTVVKNSGLSTALTFLVWLVIICCVGTGVYLFCTKVRFGS